MAKILPIRRKTPYDNSINQSIRDLQLETDAKRKKRKFLIGVQVMISKFPYLTYYIFLVLFISMVVANNDLQSHQNLILICNPYIFFTP